MIDHSRYTITRLVCERRIKSMFPTNIPEGELMYSVVEQAIMDLLQIRKDGTPTRIRLNAIEYLCEKDIPAAALCGVNSDWIRKSLTQANIYNFDEETIE